ncbi:MAG: hypothetical protein ACXW5U_06230 [Thermoanaerobaculia bacterium]
MKRSLLLLLLLISTPAFAITIKVLDANMPFTRWKVESRRPVTVRPRRT